MKRTIIALSVLALSASAHTPHSNVLQGDLGEVGKHFPPKLERAPLPPFMVVGPVPGAVVVVVWP